MSIHENCLYYLIISSSYFQAVVFETKVVFVKYSMAVKHALFLFSLPPENTIIKGISDNFECVKQGLTQEMPGNRLELYISI